MKIVVEEIQNISETEIIIKCKHDDDSVRKIVSHLELLDDKIIAKKDDRSYSISPSDIYYFESVDQKVFLCTTKDVFETSFKLYELEIKFQNTLFLRVNKTTILNTAKIQFFTSSINGRMKATLKNKEEIMISRTYVSALKLVLGGRSL